MNTTKIIALISFIGILCSCNKDESTQNFSYESERNNFIEELTSFNTSYARIIDSTYSALAATSTKGWWDNVVDAVTDALHVAAADIIGGGTAFGFAQEMAIIAGLATGGTGYAVVVSAATALGAAHSSSEQIDKLSANPPEKVQMHTGNLNIQYPTKYISLSNTGKLHNEYAVAIYNNTLDPIHISDTLTIKLLEDKEFETVRLQINDYFRNYDGTLDNLFLIIDNLKRDKFITENMATVYKLFFNIYGKSITLENLEDIINKYIDSIASATFLTEDEKSALISSFSVASESPCLWYNQI